LLTPGYCLAAASRLGFSIFSHDLPTCGVQLRFMRCFACRDSSNVRKYSAA
jgi:hypothetical protein